MMDFLSTGLLVLRNELKQQMSVRFIRNNKSDATEEELAHMTNDRIRTSHSHRNNYTYCFVSDFHVDSNSDSFDDYMFLELLD